MRFSENSQDAIKCIRLIVARYVEILEKQKVSKDEIEAQKFSLVNHKDEEGNTAMHLAAENESVEIVRTLFDDYQADLFIEWVTSIHHFSTCVICFT